MIDPTGPIDADGVVPIRDLVEKPAVDDAPSDLIIIGRYVLTPDVFDEIDRAAARAAAASSSSPTRSGPRPRAARSTGSSATSNASTPARRSGC